MNPKNSRILKRCLLMIALSVGLPFAANAQERVGDSRLDGLTIQPTPSMMPDTVLSVSPDAFIAPLSDEQSLALPPLTYRGTIAHYPYYGSILTGYPNWNLHRGLNASLSASAIFGLGHSSGSGFANSLSVMYADTITSRLSFAVGGYYSILNFGGRQLNDVGLSAMLGYRFNDHWEASAFVQKSIMEPTVPPQLYWMSDVGDKIGASLRYNFNPSFSVSLSVWNERRPLGPIPLYGPASSHPRPVGFGVVKGLMDHYR